MGKQWCDSHNKWLTFLNKARQRLEDIRAKFSRKTWFLEGGKDNAIKRFVGENIGQAPVIDLNLFSKGPKRFLTYDNTLIQSFFKDAQDGVLQCVNDTDTVLITQWWGIPKIDDDCSEIYSYQEFLNLPKSESFALICKDGRFYIRDTVAIKQKLPNKNENKQKLKLTV